MAVGIVGYGAYIPRFRIAAQEIAQSKQYDEHKALASIAVREKSLPGPDEDTITMGVQAAHNALARAAIAPNVIDAVYIGSESHPYAVKPSATIIATACGIMRDYKSADLEFACKGGTAALQIAMSMVHAGMARYALAAGSDVAQANQHDILAFAAGAGSAAFIVGSQQDELLVSIDATYSLSSDTPDFWRRSLQKYPIHVGRFTAEPAYFAHIIETTRTMLQNVAMTNRDIDYVIFHQPNGRFPVSVAHKLGFTSEQYLPGLLAPYIGNTYSACSLLGLTAVLDRAPAGKKILLVSYGSGSGSDAFIMTTLPRLVDRQNSATTTQAYIDQKTMVSYPTYQRYVDALQ